MFDPLEWLAEELAAWEALGLRRRRAARTSLQGPWIEVGGRRFSNFGSNDYLGLAAGCGGASTAEVAEFAGWGSGASPLVTGYGASHEELERELARFEGTAATLLFSTGYAANAGTIPALASKGDVIFSDAKNHASLIDGCRLSGARIVVYPHLDLTALRGFLAQAGPFRRRLIVTDSLFSMDGDLAPLGDLVELAEEYRALLVVDEAHATGVVGKCGRGVAELYGVDAKIPVRIGTLSKALGAVGGFVAGRQELIDWLSQKARTFVFSTALPDVCVEAARRNLEVVVQEPARRLTLWERATAIREHLRTDGWDIGQSGSQIIPVYLGDPESAMGAAAFLRERNLWVPAIRPPTVPEGESLLRISVTWAHSDTQLQTLLEALRELREPNPRRSKR